MALPILNDNDFQDTIGQSGFRLVKFSAVWCRPCKMLAPILEALQTEWGNKLSMYEMDTDKNPVNTVACNITSVPTLILFKDGQEIARQSGAAPKSHTQSWLEQHVK